MDAVDRAGILVLRGVKSLQPARQLIIAVRPPDASGAGPITSIAGGRFVEPKDQSGDEWPPEVIAKKKKGVRKKGVRTEWHCRLIRKDLRQVPFFQASPEFCACHESLGFETHTSCMQAWFKTGRIGVTLFGMLI